MKTPNGKLLLSLALVGALTACDGNPVEVAFQAPFPAGGANLARFRPRDQGRYQSTGDTTVTLALGPTSLVQQQWVTEEATSHQLDSLGLPRRAGQWKAGGQRFRVQPLAAGTFWVSQQLLDTVFAISSKRPGVLRHYQGWYYLSTPDLSKPDRWQVERLAVAGSCLQRQHVNPDSLRINALDTSAVRLQREPSRLLFTIGPSSRHAMHQVGSYAGLWLPLGEYLRVTAAR